MTYSLAEVQQQFGQALRYQNQGELCHIVSDHFTSEQRIQIYRNNFVISVIDVLRATYPLCEALVGEACFEQLARQHALAFPPTSGDITTYGKGFEKTIEQVSSVTEAAPYLPDVATFEWCFDSTHDQLTSAHPESVQPLAALPNVDESQHSQLVFLLSSHIVLFQSNFALYTLRQAIQSGHLEGLDIHRPESGFVRHQQDGSLETQIISAPCFELLSYLAQQLPLGAIAPELLTHLNALIELDVIAGFSIHES